MNMQRNATIYTLSPPSPSDSNSLNRNNQSHIASASAVAIHQQQQLHSPIKTEPDYDCIDESDQNTLVTHNYSRNHQNNDEQSQILSLAANNQQYLSSSGGGGGNNSDSENNLNGNYNSNIINQQSSSSSPPIHHHQTVSSLHQRSSATNSLNASPTSWNQPIQIIPRHHKQQQQLQQQQQKLQQQQPLQSHQNVPPPNAFGILSHESQVLYITEACTEIGRNSSTSSVHFHVAKNSFVSRKHMKIIFDDQSADFYLICLSKNGVFIDDMFQRRSTEAMKLPKEGCTFRFPSTEIRIVFESYADKLQLGGNIGAGDSVKGNFKTVENSNVIYSPLKITIPKTEQKSPFPSPTGTISAANSCPTSPRGFQEYPPYHYNNNNNFQNGLFPPPPTTSSTNEHEKPPYSYAQLIVQSISAAADKQLTLSGIYSFISKHYPYYRKEANKGWQNSIRHNLSLNRYFIKVARSQDEPGKGSFWRIDPNSEAKLIDQSYKKRRQRGSQCFRPPYGMPRSAPVSPSHIDNSRENSPLRDIVLQSAPGSPGVSYQNSHNDNHPGSEDSSYIQQLAQSSQHLAQSLSYQQANSSTNSYYTTSSTTTTTTSSTNQQSTTLKRHQTSNIHHGGGGGGGGVGNILNINNSNNSATAAITISKSSTHPGGEIYDDIPDYSASGADSGDECEMSKRQKYTTSDEIN